MCNSICLPLFILLFFSYSMFTPYVRHYNPYLYSLYGWRLSALVLLASAILSIHPIAPSRFLSLSLALTRCPLKCKSLQQDSWLMKLLSCCNQKHLGFPRRDCGLEREESTSQKQKDRYTDIQNWLQYQIWCGNTNDSRK